MVVTLVFFMKNGWFGGLGPHQEIGGGVGVGVSVLMCWCGLMHVCVVLVWVLMCWCVGVG